MDDDIVDRLSQHAEWLSATRTGEVCADAADEIGRLRAEEKILTDYIMFLIDHSQLWGDDGWSIQMPDGWRYHRG